MTPFHTSQYRQDLMENRGCTSALIRLVYAVKFTESSDTSYFFSIVGLCSLVEVTCGVLVLCVPTTPKALAGIAQTRAFTILKSWTTSLRAFRGSQSGPLWPARKQGVTQDFDEQPLTTTHPIKTEQQQPAITMVTRISLTEEYNAHPGEVDHYYLKDLPRRGGYGTHTHCTLGYKGNPAILQHYTSMFLVGEA